MPQTTPIVRIENVVASATIDQKLDLDEITEKFPDVEYNSEQFPGAVFRLKSPKTATMTNAIVKDTHKHERECIHLDDDVTHPIH